ncbi:MAG: ABC transporter ATP-binding protein [Methylococcaceae bacterium]|nr:ABC transporter ATP-binding protein [Methylococcaceae bacterium]
MTHINIHIKSKRYPAIGQAQPHLAIENLQLSVQPSEFICLVGPSGCGKTTLFNIIAGLDQDFEGDISLATGQQRHPKIGYVFQNPRLLPWRTVRENIELALSGPQSNDSIASLIAAMQLTDMQHVYPERLSLGMSRRVAIIRAFAVNPDLLLMDEPFVSIDAPTARQVRTLLLQLWQQRPHSVLFVTHDLREAIALADRLVFLSPPPMSVITEISVPITRQDRNDDAALEAFRQQLLHDYPKIRTLV